MAQSARTGTRLHALDGLRGIAALAIVVLHVWMFVYGDAGHQAKGAFELAVGELRLGVSLFFVLSGFLLHRAFAGAILDGRPRPSLARYALHRAARILPGYWLAVAGALAVTGYLGHPLWIEARQLPVFLLFAQNQVEETSRQLDPPMWTLGVEVSFYLLLPVVAVLARGLGPSRGRQLALCCALLALGTAFTAVAWQRAWPATVTTSLVTYLPHFAAGMAAAVLVHGRRASARAGAALALAGAVLVVLNGVWHACSIGPYDVRVMVGDVPAAAGFALLVAALAGTPLRIPGLTSRPALVLGDLSYALYLWHYLAIVWLRGTERWSPDLVDALASTLVLSLAAAGLSWLLVERPVLRLVRRIPVGRRGPAPAPAPAPVL